ncbi:hypothetical protein A3D84_02405 [Candidatus Woesebacteria bacterium RIFCSPHIGHO2_02_FULL_42_20]|uniref:Nucleotidyl transferase AbiEii/AbiGii toxin family protein n=1 Tax=Candidatus Woesebacteria bacterium RIFCSPHIGHO2_12_FULL_41_24 TaxID=1802510 RepID=A0A1F8ASR0_9BACT|nr:MAG: hypothetical protein A2W15_00025 [Candidatus Woesebacteria bacterium RBG_16_41_13]OGM29441.1 MAG: hypothetical protein A2873_05110 [Candidatus Woesebacteria bacterium RIFCSPHIGHO2_01_FULL_42_80]OGM35020.1 MAG: hypothetical protein A3D84_02405 [Candidatus Woesebacteria bacterium RIFCSPHIGHO2_02_FULL_42_20]OGM54787.1 MAG: hypothetical protein A3E44_01360 [Candidatus Woesebacteria bacterium RIFCSPHIGHO2_12_FULL_41_24]OGM68335.1 MAG: hypothetical protein A2969_03020 [Candidatus Woesebacteri
MILLRPQDTIHKVQLTRLLTEILDNPTLSQNLYFKGGTCAAMLGYLDRFSVDLDFDLKQGADKATLRSLFHKIFKRIDSSVKDESKKALEFILKYEAPANQRNTIKLDALDLHAKANIYKDFFLPEIVRYAKCQTIETMFANKLVALTDRYDKRKSIAGRDVYDIHHFYTSGYRYNGGVITERTNLSITDYFKKLAKFVETKVTQTIINQDLNTLLPYDKFKKVRKTLKNETLAFLNNEILSAKTNN